MSEASKDDFRAIFDPKRIAIERDLAELPNIPKSEIQAAVDNLVQRIRLLEKSVTDNIGILPPFDTRICLEAIKAASERLSVLRGQLIPRQKFSFKSRKTVATSQSVLQVANATSAASTVPSQSVDKGLFMTFENRAGEYLFIGDLQLPSTSATAANATSPNDMEIEEVVYLGGVQVNMSTTAPVIEKPKDVALTNLTDCTINLVHTLPLGAIHIKNLKRCVLVIPPSRMHTSTNMDIYLHVTSEPIIEECTDMRFAPYPYHEVLPADQLHGLFVAAGLRPEKNLFDHVKDFNWLRQQQSPNWRILDASEMRQGIAHHVLYTQRT
ncbi:hypothetical protein BGX23_001711 [Mortierella sp. AD031]|nr:hypothetical protein BGX23_001711 [Mortierella sp. AD031]